MQLKTKSSQVQFYACLRFFYIGLSLQYMSNFCFANFQVINILQDGRFEADASVPTDNFGKPARLQ